jgi:hypothetical protein
MGSESACDLALKMALLDRMPCESSFEIALPGKGFATYLDASAKRAK